MKSVCPILPRPLIVVSVAVLDIAQAVPQPLGPHKLNLFLGVDQSVVGARHGTGEKAASGNAAILEAVIVLFMLTALCFVYGVCSMYNACAEHRDQAFMLDEERSKRAEARITEKNEDDAGYHVSYEFEFQRHSDGRRCKVVVKRRHVPDHVWTRLAVGATEYVRYLEDDPKHCRLEAGMDYDEFHGVKGIARLSLSLFCLLIGSLLPLMMVWHANENEKSAGAVALLVLVWICCVGCICTEPPAVKDAPVGTHPTEGSTLHELDWTPASGDLGDLSGVWLVEAEDGSFEYMFTMDGSTASAVCVQGKAVGESAYQPSCQAHFVMRGINECLCWQDIDETTFTIEFSSDEQSGRSTSQTRELHMTTFRGFAQARDSQIPAASFTGRRQEVSR